MVEVLSPLLSTSLMLFFAVGVGLQHAAEQLGAVAAATVVAAQAALFLCGKLLLLDITISHVKLSSHLLSAAWRLQT